MALITVILLGLILVTLVCILLVSVGSLDNLQKHSESIHDILNNIHKEKILDLTYRLIDLFNISTDINYHQKRLREQEMGTAIETLKSIESKLSDLKLLNDTLLSLKRSLEIIVAHPTFTIHDDKNKNLIA